MPLQFLHSPLSPDRQKQVDFSLVHRLARHRQLQQFLFHIATHQYRFAEVSRLVCLVGHPQYQAVARQNRLFVILRLRAAARGVGVENHQGAVARILQDELRRLLLPPVKTAHVRFRTVGLHRSLCTGRFLLLTDSFSTDDFQVELLDLRVVDGVADGQHPVVLVEQESLESRSG